MQNRPAQPLTPLSEEELIRLRREKRAKEQWGIEQEAQKLPGLWPDIRPPEEKNPPDLSDITRDIARGS